MTKIMRTVLIAFLAALGTAALSQAAATKFTDLQCRNMTITGSLTSNGCTCTNISTATLTTASITASTITVSGAQAIRLPANYITANATVPAAANILGIDSAHILYISTGTGAGAWVKVGGQ